MNWENIKTKYPKAWIKLEKYFAVSIDQDEEWQFGRLINEWCAADDSIYRCPFENRKLYDFFDGQGIYIEICLDSEFTDYDGEVVLPDCFCYQLYHNIKDAKDILSPAGFCAEFKTRIEAEEKAFEKAFEILENKLKIEGVK